MEFIELKLIEKIADIFARAMRERKYNRYQFLEKWCASETCQAVFDFDETLCSQAKSYILRTFEKEYENNLPDIDEDSPLYEDDMYWMGYVITYWYFMEELEGIEESKRITGKQMLKEYDMCKALDEYDVLHTISVKAAIRKIKEDDRRE